MCYRTGICGKGTAVEKKQISAILVNFHEYFKHYSYSGMSVNQALLITVLVSVSFSTIQNLQNGSTGSYLSKFSMSNFLERLCSTDLSAVYPLKTNVPNTP